MTEHSVLIFAYHYPPDDAIGGARPFRFAKYLTRLGYKCRVFTAADQTGREDPDTEYIPDPFVAHPQHGLGWQTERAIRKLFLPGDTGIRWSYHAARAARSYIEAHSGSYITLFSTFPPLGAHLAAWQLARSEGLPWIADLRDPFPDGTENKMTNSLRQRVYRWLERDTARKARAIIANTDGAMIRWRENVPSLDGKLHLIWNGFDPEERIHPLPIPPRNCKILTHVGYLYGGRNATPILESIARLIAAKRLQAGTARIRLIGDMEPGALPNPVFLSVATKEGWLELVTQRIPQGEGLRLARSSDYLLLLQPQSTTQVPGKLFEYLQIGRPILAFLHPDSPSERVLAQSGVPYMCVYPESKPETIDETLVDFFSLPATAVAAGPWFDEQFSAENQTGTLNAIIRSLHCGPIGSTNNQPASPNAKSSV